MSFPHSLAVLPTLFGPLHGIGSEELFALFRGYGPIGVCCLPFVRITAHPPVARHLAALVPREHRDTTALQLLGVDRNNLGEAARILSEARAELIDVNLGCPSRQVVRKGAGAGLLTEPERVGELLRAVRAQTRGHLSVKMRVGLEDGQACLEVAKLAEAAGVDYLVLHPRSRRQGYTGVADWTWVKVLTENLAIPVVGNGDCWYADDALALMHATGCRAVMLARPALRNPWIFGQIAARLANHRPFIPKGRDLLNHVHNLARLLGQPIGRREATVVGGLKEHIRYLTDALPIEVEQELAPRLLGAQTIDELLTLAEPLAGLERLDLAPDGPLRRRATPSLSSL